MRRILVLAAFAALMTATFLAGALAQPHAVATASHAVAASAQPMCGGVAIAC